MSTFLSGVDCGPGNALKTVTGRVDRDFSLQQDRLVSTPNIAGSSRQVFKTNPAATQISQYAPKQPQLSPSPFDLASLRQHFPPAPLLSSQGQGGDWAKAFVPRVKEPLHSGNNVGPPAVQQRTTPWQNEFQQHRNQGLTTTDKVGSTFQNSLDVGVAPWQRQQHVQPHRPLPPMLYPQRPFQPPYQLAPPPPQAFHQPHQPSQAQTTQSQAQSQQLREPLTESQELLAQTAQSFVDQLTTESDILQANPKLAQSGFMELLRALGEKEVVVQDGEVGDGEYVGEGAKFVERSHKEEVARDWVGDYLEESTNLGCIPMRSWNTEASGASSWEKQFQDQEALLQSSRPVQARRKSVHFDDSLMSETPLGTGVPSTLEQALSNSTAIPGAQSTWQESSIGDDTDFDEEAFMNYNGGMRQVGSPRIGVGGLESWGALQKDWEAFTKGEDRDKAKGVMRGMGRGDQVDRYLFQSGNPYQAGMMDIERFGRESPTVKSVLELEAAVQNDPTDHEAWFALGLKQQENEREDHAILALSKVVQLDPDYRPAYLALAVSYTNEGEGQAANEMLNKWIRMGEGGSGSVGEGAIGMDEQSTAESRAELVRRLIGLARKSPETVDADVQVALGVLFNASEEYESAEDCFLAALSERPDDWLLYNRLGATLANSGRSNEALQYYHRALSLHPNFVRALFNLGIAYTNLAQYPLAAQNTLDALRLQHADATEGYEHSHATGHFGKRPKGPKGVTSSTLWNSLRSACMHMGRHDLVDLAAKQDLSGFPASLVAPEVAATV